MEQRLIDANALKESFRKQTVNVQEKIKESADAIIEAICKDIDLAPTVDSVPVVHAYWTTKRTWQHDGEIYCSACENDAPTEGDYRQEKTKYCPNCGAKMDANERRNKKCLD